MKKLILLIVILTCVFVFSPKPAHAASELEIWCVAEGQTWALLRPGQYVCDVTGIATVSSSGSLTVLANEYISNDGTINNYGTIVNEGTINNHFNISNYGNIYNDAGGIINNGNWISNQYEGTIDNYGTINNYDTINNNGTIVNEGTINNYCQAIYTGYPPIGIPVMYHPCRIWVPLIRG